MKKSTLSFILLLLALAAVGIYGNRPLSEKEYKKLRFETCIESHPSDYVCDSCYKAIYGNKK